MTDTTTSPAWTHDPVAAAQHRPRWPDTAETFDADDRVELQQQARWRYDDPRPQSGYVLKGRYCGEFPACDHAAHQRYECVRCGLAKVLGVERANQRQQIRFSCPAGRKVTYHNPAGVSYRRLIPYD